MKTLPLFFKDSQAKWEHADEGITRKFVGYNESLMLVKVRFEKGAIGAVHNHEHSQGSYVASGSFKITINGETQILKAGDGFFVPPQADHGAECLEAGILVDVFNPAREDFLEQ